ncbi:Glucans biosynthesis protein G precursor [compost metagenome]
MRSQISVGDNAEVVENNLRYNPESKGWRLTLRLKVKEANKSTEMRAALVRDVAVEPAKPVAKEAKQDKAAAKHAKAEKDAKAEQPAADAASTNGTPATTEKVLTETWSYQLPADE